MIFDLRIPPLWLAYAAVAGVCIAGLGYGYLRYRRFASLRRLRRRVREAAYDMMMDVLIPDGMDGKLHVDFLLLTQRGILVLNLRETSGLIFGGDQMDEWTVMTRRSRYGFANPQSSLFDRVAAVKLLAGETPVEGRVLFTARARFPKGQPKCVLMLDSLRDEFSPADPAALQALMVRYQLDWDTVKAAAEPSNLKRY